MSTITGTEHLSDAEKKEIAKLKLPKDYLDGTYFSFLLGKNKADNKPSKYKTLTWNEFLKYTRDRDLSKQDLAAIRQARDNAGIYIKSFTDDLANNIFKELQAATGDIVTEAMLRDIIQDETAMAVLERSSVETFTNALENRFRTQGKKDWQKIARTELHKAKQQGVVSTIVNKEEIYANSAGIDSHVSIVVQSNACLDCKNLYLEANGNPKVFVLRDLISNGINTNHKRVGKLHGYWHPTVPPVHSSCFCELIFTPPGHSWVDGKLTLTKPEEFQKAFFGFGKKTAAPVKPPSLAGVSSPAQEGNKQFLPGQSQGQQQGNPSSGIEYEYWPAGRGRPSKDGGWESYKKKDGTAGYRRPKGSGGGKGAQEEEQPQKDPAQVAAEAKAYGKVPKPTEVVIKHLQEGRIVQQENLADAGEAGVTESFRVTIEGNGRGIMKPPAWNNNIYAQLGVLATEGSGSCPVGTGHLREKAAFSMFNSFGVSKVPPTVVRSHEGQPVSIQAWSETKESISSKVNKGKFGDVSKLPTYSDGTPLITNETKFVLDSVTPEQREKLIESFKEANVMGILINHNDQHLGNVMIGEDMSLSFIDNTTAFGNGMFGTKIQTHMEMHNMGIKTTIPEHLQERFKHTTLSDLMRDNTDIEDWAVGQTYMRMKYMMYLQETEGHLDYEKFRPCIRGGASDSILKDRLKGAEAAGDPNAIKHYKDCLGVPRSGFWAGSDREVQDDYDNRKANGLLSHQLFDSFCKQWINDSKTLPETHPDRIAADQLDKIGIFMDPSSGFTLNVSDYRSSGQHRDFEKTIKPGYPPRKVKGSDGVVEATTTKKTAPSARKKPPSNKQGQGVDTPEARAQTHLVLDLDEGVATKKKDVDVAVSNIMGSIKDSDIDDLFSNITASSEEPDDSDDDIIDLSEEIGMLDLFTKSKNPKLYIKI